MLVNSGGYCLSALFFSHLNTLLRKVNISANGRKYDLGQRVYQQSIDYHAGKLSKEKEAKLNGIGSDWRQGSEKGEHKDCADAPAAAKKPEYKKPEYTSPICEENWDQVCDYLNKYQEENGNGFSIPKGYVG